jgi:hypothetical protein
MNVCFEKVSFSVEYAESVTKEEFIERHVGVFWLDRSEDVRRKMLSDAYDIITKGAGQ